MQISKLILTLLVLVALISCSENATAPQQDTGGESGQEVVPEEVLATLEQFAPDDAAISEAIAGVTLANWPSDGPVDLDVYLVTFAWGSFVPGLPGGDAVDWSGTLSANAVGAVEVVHTISFEEGEDEVLENPSITQAAWISLVSADFDGLIFLVTVDRSVDYFVAPTLTFTTEPFEISYYFEDLENFAAYYPIDESSGVAVAAKRLWHHSCPGGLIEGVWEKDDLSGETGYISGMWLDVSGEPVGVAAGWFWTDESGHGLFQGSVSGVFTDEVILEYEGRWMYDDLRLCPLCGSGHGLFWGHYTYVAEDKFGHMCGIIGDYAISVEQLDIPMSGVWHDYCTRFELVHNR